MIKASQIHAARSMAGLSIADLAEAAGLKVDDVSALEEGNGSGDNSVAVEAVKRALERAGIEFVTAGETEVNGEVVAIRHNPSSSDGIRPENLNATNDR